MFQGSSTPQSCMVPCQWFAGSQFNSPVFLTLLQTGRRVFCQGIRCAVLQRTYCSGRCVCVCVCCRRDCLPARLQAEFTSVKFRKKEKGTNQSSNLGYTN